MGVDGGGNGDDEGNGAVGVGMTMAVDGDVDGKVDGECCCGVGSVLISESKREDRG